MNDQLLVLKKFPLVVPQNRDFTLYKGFIQAGSEEFYICLHVPHYPFLNDLSIRCSWELSVILQGHEKNLNEWTKSCSSLFAYLECLQNLIMKCLEAGTAASLLHSDHHLLVKTYKHIISELEVLGLDHVLHVSSSLNEVKLQTVDQAGRNHILNLSLGMNYPSSPPVIHADLPEQLVRNIKTGSSLAAIYKSFVQQVSGLQMFWEVLDEVDRECWVIDPDNPTRKDMYRRIVIGSNVSIQITVDPFNATKRPDIKFLGSERAIIPFKKSLTEKFQFWSSDDGFIQNLKFVLGLSGFPAAPADTGHPQDLLHQGECAICFMARLEGELPSQACDNEKCGMLYHLSCLFEWLQTLPTSNKSFNYVHGECPNCSMAISCPKPSLYEN
ncbi:E3 ubiquitin-protein ligase FANCL isoform X2 [Zootermopsis nevadensis]|uniref:E3 ubiquitin-protein ligase FANCL n=1 Tax=Zootermopsis nevadensis TaxID=136037 RepID=A0A067QTB2_ZOONE|nr:E3 ubiquitin-protein ligase FANCL isoform X2 [Zootermopsis nevadensis]KDR06870.1 E3 ubiquitin-protein ligase FANCL [Zootermopsis nevadensis]